MLEKMKKTGSKGGSQYDMVLCAFHSILLSPQLKPVLVTKYEFMVSDIKYKTYIQKLSFVGYIYIYLRFYLLSGVSKSL